MSYLITKIKNKKQFKKYKLFILKQIF